MDIPEERKGIRVELVSSPKNFVERISPYSSLFISGLALILSVYSAYETRDHNRRSAKPDVVFWQDGTLSGTQLGISIRNDGLGPASISQFRIYLDGVRVAGWEELRDKTGPLYKGQGPSWRVIDYALTVRPGEKADLYWASPDKLQQAYGFQQLITKRLFVIAKSCSIYEECKFVCSTRDDGDCEAEEAKVKRSPKT